jgi:hypothetical protein
MSVDDQIKMSFEFCSDNAKQLIALSSGIVAVTITLCKEVFKNTTPASRKVLLWAWMFYLASVVCGMWTLSALTGTLDPEKKATLSIYASNIRIPAFLQALTFIAATALVVVFGALSLRRAGEMFQSDPTSQPPAPQAMPPSQPTGP